MSKMTTRIVLSSLLALSLAACSSSKSAEKGSSEGDQAAEKQQMEGEQGKKAGGMAESADPSNKEPKKQMHQLHSKLVERYVENRETYLDRQENGESQKVREVYTKLVQRHDKIAEKYGHDLEDSQAKSKKKGGTKGDKPKWKHVKKMAGHQTKTAELHREAAQLEGEAGDEELNTHHSNFADAYDRLAGMHAEVAKRMKKKSESGGEKKTDGEQTKGSEG